MNRLQCLRAIYDLAADWPVLLTTGHTCRDAYAAGDRAGNFYMVGSMGLAASIGLGLAMESNFPTTVVDGDGSLLMNPSNLFLAGHYKPSNFQHIVLDNCCYESTGGQRTIAESANFVAVARACGFQRCVSAATLDELRAALRGFFAQGGATFIHCALSGPVEITPRVPLRLPFVRQRFRCHLERLRAVASAVPNRGAAG